MIALQGNFRNSVFETPATLQEGYLLKKSSGAIKRWQKRYFVLQTHYLKVGLALKQRLLVLNCVFLLLTLEVFRERSR
jgi:hypothetical protein